jgi:dTDP-glucose pyrophosphorylase
MGKPIRDLVVLAAGVGSRFGGLKQVEPVGPQGELIIEYSAFDARRAGFDRLVLVIRRDTLADFHEAIGRRLERQMEIVYAFQEIGTVPAGWSVPAGRVKPWGTGHAVLAARDGVRGAFAVVNADDFYGAAAYRALATHFAATGGSAAAYAMVGYPLRQTLSENGAVSRGVCATGADGRLRSITEITRIEKAGEGARYLAADGSLCPLTGDEVVSLNFWGLTPAVFPQLDRQFAVFLDRHGAEPKAEFYLPTALSALIDGGEADVALYRSEDAWFGITYREDLRATRAAIRELVAQGKYPEKL